MKVFLTDDQRRTIVESLYVYSNKLKSDWKDDMKDSIKDLAHERQQEIRMLIKLLELE